MELASWIYIIPHIASIFFFSFIVFKYFKKPKNVLVWDFLRITIVMIAVSILKLLELLSKSDYYTILFGKVYTALLIFLTSLTLVFILRYVEENKYLKKKIVALIFIVPVIGFFAILTSNFHSLYFSSLTINHINSDLSTMIKEFSVIGFIVIFYNYTETIIFVSLLIRNFFQRNYLYKKQIIVLLIGVVMPVFSNMLFIFFPAISDIFGSDLTIFSFMITSPLFLWSVINYKFLNIAPLARNEIFDELDDAIIVMNSRNKIVDLNKKALEFADKLGIRKFNIGSNADELVKMLKISLEKDSEFIVPKRNESTYSSTVKKIFMKNMQVGVILSIKDITKIKEFERIKADSKKEKEINNLRYEFITRVSHELRQPLMPIIAYSNELKEIVKSKKGNQYLEKIISNSENLQHLVEKTIRLSSIKADTKTNFEKRKLSEVLKNINLCDRVKVEILNDSDALIDTSQMIEAINNIIDNSLAYSKKEVIIELDQKGKNSVISITDKGQGISKKILDDIMKGNYLAKIDAKELKKGFGIGIMITKMIVQAHNGELEIESKEGKGTTVKIILPSA